MTFYDVILASFICAATPWLVVTIVLTLLHFITKEADK